MQRANAIEHAYWNALITYLESAPAAALFTTAHEFSNRFRDGGLAHDAVMDLHNNAVGRSVAVNVSPNNWLANVRAELNAAAFDGRLWIIDTTTNLVIRSDGRKILN